MSAIAHVERLDGVAALAVEDDLRRIYAEAFAEAPYCEGPPEVDRAFARFRTHARRSGFRAALARDGQGVPTGMGYGYPLSSASRWWDSLAVPAPEALRREDGHRTFGLFELGVRPAWRRQGIAAALHTALLDGLPQERVVLNTHPQAVAANAAYLSWGYVKIGESRPWDGAPLHNMMLRALHKPG
jgi:GNAT superfamily N-acetyltransferase